MWNNRRAPSSFKSGVCINKCVVAETSKWCITQQTGKALCTFEIFFKRWTKTQKRKSIGFLFLETMSMKVKTRLWKSKLSEFELCNSYWIRNIPAQFLNFKTFRSNAKINEKKCRLANGNNKSSLTPKMCVQGERLSEWLIFECEPKICSCHVNTRSRRKLLRIQVITRQT